MTDSSTRPLKVFLCHSSGDKATVRELYRQLSAEGWIDVWLDEMKLLPGQEWDIEIEKAVEEADIVLVCLSNRSVDKEGYVQKELRFVLNIADEKPEGSIFVIPLRLDDCVVPRRLKHWQWVDYFPESQKPFTYTRLLESFKVRARKLGILFNKSKVEPVPASAPVVAPQKQQKEENPKPESELQPKPIASETKAVEVGVARQTTPKKKPLLNSKVRLFIGVASILLLVPLCIMGLIKYTSNNLFEFVTTTATSELAQISQPVKTSTPSPTKTFAPPTPTHGIGSTMTGKDGMTLLYVPAGEFIMGSNAMKALAECQKIRSDCEYGWFSNEEPQHSINLGAFWIDQTEVTNTMYAKCVQNRVCNSPTSARSETRESYFGNPEFDEYPVVAVSWESAQIYCAWVDRRLPSEAEWEKAARGEDTFVYPWGNEFDGEKVNFCDKNCSWDWANESYDDGFADTSPVGNYQFGSNTYGVLDMAGNVWEWVADWYDGTYYSKSPSINPLGPSSGEDHTLRGGSLDGNENDVRSTNRAAANPNYTSQDVGFRCAISATP